MRAGPSVIAFADPAFVDAFAVRAAATLTRVLARVVAFHKTGMTLTLIRCHAVAVIAIFATGHASTSTFGSILRDRAEISFRSDSRIFEDESIVAFASPRRDARAIVAR